MKNQTISPKSEIIFFSTPEGDLKIEVFFEDETVWLTQRRMAELFDVTSQNITVHIKNIYESDELEESSTCKEILQVRKEGDREVERPLKYYNLDVVLSVGYRVNSKRATQFRIWATKTLREYIVKGFVLDDERLKNGTKFGKDYFQELLERVRSIRASERRIYQKIADIFAECSIDYNPKSEITRDFYAMVQNKFHFAITGNTAAEIIYTKSDKDSPNMGLTTWKNSPNGRILKSDTETAKNYLEEKEIKSLERTVSGFFDYIENIVENRKTFTMAEFAESVDKFLSFNEYKVLHGKGRISMKKAKEKANLEYDEFNKTQKIESDFDKKVQKFIETKQNE